jgi:hypothetical protein
VIVFVLVIGRIRYRIDFNECLASHS